MTELHNAPGVDTDAPTDNPSPEYSMKSSENSETSTTNVPPSPEPEKAPESDGHVAEKVPSGAPLDRVPSQAQRLGKKKIFVVMLALCLVLFLAALDMTIISTALPTMATYFHASASGYSWMASSYLLANAACIPLWGKISDIWGRKSIMLLANFIFLAGSLISALAINLPMILAGRAIQGVGGGGIIVLAQISVTDLFSVRERPLYYGLFGVTWAVASALGPIIGGAFTTSVTWRWCFYLNLPIGGVSFAILLFFLKVETEKVPLLDGLRSIDWLGTILIVGGTLMFLFGLEFGGVSYPWKSATVICLIVFGVVTWALAMLVEWKWAKYPVIPTRIFNNLHNILVLLICFFHGAVFIAGSYYLPLYFQTVLLASPILSGVYVLPQVVALSLVSAVTGIVIKKTGRYRELIIGGLACMTLGAGLFINLKPYASWPRIIIYQIIFGIGVGPLFQTPLVALQANIHVADMATATATFGFVRQTSAAVSVVLGTVIYQNVLAQRIAQLHGVLDQRTTETIIHSFAGSDKKFIDSLSEHVRRIILQALSYTLNHMWIFYTCLGGIAVIVSLFIRPVTLSKAHTMVKTGLAEQERARQEILAAQKAKNSPSDPEKGTAQS